MRQAENLSPKINGGVGPAIIGGAEAGIKGGSAAETGRGCRIMPIYAAKGLEFDAVLIYGADDANYYTELDGRLLYIACTRALHRLSLYYTGRKSRFLEGRGYHASIC